MSASAVPNVLPETPLCNDSRKQRRTGLVLVFLKHACSCMGWKSGAVQASLAPETIII